MKFKDLKKLIDSKVCFKTPDGNFEGVLKMISKQAERVTFEHVFLIPSYDYLGTMHVLISDIDSCVLLVPADQIMDDAKFDSSQELLYGGLAKSTRIDEGTIEISSEENALDYLPTFLKNKYSEDFCIVDSTSAAFQRAIDHLSQSVAIGVSFHGPKISRSGSLSWICISSATCVFLFDIDQLGMAFFKKGLKSIFENEAVEKVIHDCREISDCLLHKFQTNLKNVFDTQVADYLINMQMYTGKDIFKYVNALDSCLVKYLKVPQKFLYNRNKCISSEEEQNFFQVRPISKDFINVLMKHTMYLLPLKEVQESLLNNPFEQAVQIYLNHLRSANDSDVYREPSYFTQIAPSYLLESVRSVRFYDLPQPADDFVEKFKDTLHGQKVWQQKMCTKDS